MNAPIRWETRSDSVIAATREMLEADAVYREARTEAARLHRNGFDFASTKYYDAKHSEDEASVALDTAILNHSETLRIVHQMENATEARESVRLKEMQPHELRQA